MELRNFIDGKFIDSISKKNIPVLNPANQKIVGNIDEALDQEIDLAFQAAKKAFEKRILVDMDAKEKSRMMRAIAQKLRERKKGGGSTRNDCDDGDNNGNNGNNGNSNKRHS